MKYLLDTAVWYTRWAILHLVPAGLLRLLRPEPDPGLASVGWLEVANLHRLGRPGRRGSLARFFPIAPWPKTWRLWN